MASLENYDKSQAVAIPDNAHWPGEFGGWLPKAQSSTRALDGTLITQTAPLKAGEPIELVDFWLERSALVTLKTWATQGGQYWLTLPSGVQYLVIFADEKPIQAAPVFEMAAPDTATKYQVSALNFLSQEI